MMHISGKFTNQTKQDIDSQNTESNRTLELSGRTKYNIEKLKKSISSDQIFGRNDVIKILNITPSPASALIKKMLDLRMIEPVKGNGKRKISLYLKSFILLQIMVDII